MIYAWWEDQGSFTIASLSCTSLSHDAAAGKRRDQSWHCRLRLLCHSAARLGPWKCARRGDSRNEAPHGWHMAHNTSRGINRTWHWMASDTCLLQCLCKAVSRYQRWLGFAPEGHAMPLVSCPGPARTRSPVAEGQGQRGMEFQARSKMLAYETACDAVGVTRCRGSRGCYRDGA